ncbi:cell division protein CrgA [Acidiferrimicrobium sp. IK]|uniref:cell division protein CrgA n=1 Tax=Acidiferrimicrobium sp. IK TaxID=2871700 RepID=UPI0021CAEA9E|nr:cell division protein CrgA [Acidiferrimicrobium sp. IK]MCU4186122.1 cell division protein CrgA [Acidiferrimicrobium sp. IK]
MARRTKDAPGRVTPKGGPARARGGSSRAGTEESGRPASGRYTAPVPHEWDRSSPWWVPVLMLALFGIGVLGIVLNYLGVLPGGASNVYLLIGLGCIVAGFITATQYR